MSDTQDKPTDDTAQKISTTFAPINTTDRQSDPNFHNTAKEFNKRRLSIKRLVLSLGFVVMVAAAGILGLNLINERNSTSASHEIKSVFSGEELKYYTSEEHKFTVLMPGIPTIGTTNVKSGDKDIPVTKYERIIENGSKNYTLSVYDYTEVQPDEPKLLENTLDYTIEQIPGAKLDSTKLGKYGDLNGIEAIYNVIHQDEIYEAHIRYVIKGSLMYSMTLVGGDQAKFDEFANSLRLN